MNAIGQPRQFCALGGQQTVAAIERALPIIHAGPGCSNKIFGALAHCNGFQGSGYAGGNAIPSTNATETEVVFGGEQRLREVIDGALQVMDGDLFVVLTGCTADLVGDDVPAVVAEYRRRGAPILHVSTGGFKGYANWGHEQVVLAIIDQLLEPAPRQERLVNVWSVLPYQDPFWAGNLQALGDLLRSIGLTPNLLFGHASGGIAAWRKIPAAALNLVVSPWPGLDVAQRLEDRFGTPWLHQPVLPIGAVETSAFLRAVGTFAHIDVEPVVEREEARFYHYLDRSADFFLEMRWDLPSRFSCVADSFYSIGASRFLANELGLLPGPQFVTDNPPEEHQATLRALFETLPGKPAVHFTQDSGQIADVLRAAADADHHPLILGSSWDRDLARELDGFHLSVSLPANNRLVLDRAYAGYAGGLRLMEDIYTGILAKY
jgi:nitrogenase molybdenum-iron protein beta chain